MIVCFRRHRKCASWEAKGRGTLCFPWGIGNVVTSLVIFARWVCIFFLLGFGQGNPFLALLNAVGILGSGVLGALYALAKQEKDTLDANIESVSLYHEFLHVSYKRLCIEVAQFNLHLKFIMC